MSSVGPGEVYATTLEYQGSNVYQQYPAIWIQCKQRKVKGLTNETKSTYQVDPQLVHIVSLKRRSKKNSFFKKKEGKNRERERDVNYFIEPLLISTPQSYACNVVLEGSMGSKSIQRMLGRNVTGYINL